ncbi:AAA family ATPase [Klosneuvirus KNV1]|uniref:AAA family ATPase n=1 Tax=Klosneuvirus KNV1 TaxID=1977640 RepID=A0A1V0SKH8_9VIRU|nr:AAA family ATPase [Klosneuvirus KNV1]
MYIINVNDKDVNDDTICQMMNSIGGSGNKILLFEDIDSAFADKEKVKFEEKVDMAIKSSGTTNGIPQYTQNPDRKYLTYAGLLNALDGVLSSHHGVITIMTTNYIEKLGDALIRPGRIDHRYMLGTCDYEQICKMTHYIVTKSLELIKTNHLETLSTDTKKYDDDYLEKHVGLFAEKLVDDKKESKIKPCQLQQYILKYIENPDELFQNYGELLKN